MATAKEADIASAFLRSIGGSDSALMRKAVIAWLRAESGKSIIGNNPWNISYAAALEAVKRGAPKPTGYRVHSVTGQKFAVYARPEDGAAASGKLLVGAGKDWRNYDKIVAAARKNDPIGFLNALARSAWDAGRYGTKNGGTNKLLAIYAGIGGVTDAIATLSKAIIKKVFGSAFSVSRGYSSGHDGVDLKAPKGTPIYAIAAGTVSYARNAANDPNATSFWAKGGGNVVNIDVGNKLTTQYAHLDKFIVKSGEHVNKGQLIGYVGATGDATGPHLHFGLWDHAKNKMIDPTTFIASGGQTEVGSLGAWGDIVSFPIGHIVTAADVELMMQKLRDAGFFGDPSIPGAVSEGIVRGILTTAIGQRWDKALQDRLQAQFFAAAGQAVPDLGGIGDALGSIAGVAATLVNPANWIRILALIAGAGMVAYGGVSVLKASGASVPTPATNVVPIRKAA
jgi:murein DD-endopeptidase MepM/ murein hydrolase activator NlpD